MKKWSYIHDGQVCGPLTAAELQSLANRGQLAELDLVWPSTGRPDEGMSARDLLDFSQRAPGTPAMPDWLSDVAAQEGHGPVAPVALPASRAEPPDWLSDLELWYQLEEPRATVPVARPIDAPAGSTASRASPSARALSETGFDPETGQVVDEARFRKWQRERATSHTGGAPSNANLMEVFRKARIEVEHWVDEPAHRALVIRGNLQEIGANATLVAVFEKYAQSVPALQEKLLRHLMFMVENRQRFYAARPSD